MGFIYSCFDAFDYNVGRFVQPVLQVGRHVTLDPKIFQMKQSLTFPQGTTAVVIPFC